MSLMINNDLVEKEFTVNGVAEQGKIIMNLMLSIAELMEKCRKNPDNIESKTQLSSALAEFEHIRIYQIRKMFELKSGIYALAEFNVIKKFTERMEK